MSDIISLLEDMGPALVALAGVVTGLLAIGRNVKRLRRLFTSGEHTQVVVELRELADTRLEVITELRRQLDETGDDLRHANRSLDDCERQRMEMYERLLRLIDSEGKK